LYLKKRHTLTLSDEKRTGQIHKNTGA